MRNKLLDETIFHVLDQANSVIVRWVVGYNLHVPHSALGYLTPVAFAANLTATDDRLRNPDQRHRSPVAPPAQLRQSHPETLASAR
jgi:putative transposase